MLAWRGFQRDGRTALGWHAAAILCYAASLLTYEIATAFVFFSYFVYLLWASPRRARLPGAAAAGCGVLVTAYLRAAKPAAFQVSLHDQIQRGRNIEGEARQLFSTIDIPHGHTFLPVAFAVAVVAVAAVIAWRRRDAVLRHWLVVAAAGVAVIGVGYAPFLPTGDWYSPLREGIGNRTNAAAAIGYVLLIAAIVVLTARLLSLALPRSMRPGIYVAVTGVAAALIGGLWVHQINRDRQAWDRAAAIRRSTLVTLRESLPRPKPGSTIFTFGVPGTHRSSRADVLCALGSLRSCSRLLCHHRRSAESLSSRTTAGGRCRHDQLHQLWRRAGRRALSAASV